MERSDQANNDAAKGKGERRSLLLRSAKVVCQSGEYVCLVRDVGAHGTKLGFLHEAPPDRRMILVLANGLTCPIERLWAGRSQAGYRFAADISIAEFLHESRPFDVRPIRLAIAASARIVDGSDSHVARLADLSTGGAGFVCDARIAQGRLVSFQLAGMPQQLGEVVWSETPGDGVHHGLEFRHALGLRELAGIALHLQPFASRHMSAPGTGSCAA
jgi:hypothetical protein